MRKHAKLRGALIAADMTERQLARELLRGVTYVSQRMSGKEPWALDECYKILDIIRVPHDQLHVYFPPGGVSA